MLATCGLGFLAFCVLVGVTYARTPVPDAQQKGVNDQGTSVFWGDSKKTPLLRLGEPRENVKLPNIPPYVQHAVLAAEDRNFETEPGISPTGIARAVYTSATGGEVTGGSTITQQLARNYYAGLSQQRSFSRKFKEIFISLRLGKEKPKSFILETYLNTIYFGRQANGVQAASRAFFHKNVDKLSVSEAALIAAMIQRPEYFHTTGDPNTDPARKALQDRWTYVLDGMVKMGWLSPADRQAQVFPKTEKHWNYIKETPESGYIRERVLKELRTVGITGQMINTQGYKIYTSLNPRLMAYAKQAVKQAGPSTLPRDVRIGMVSVNPLNGEIPAFYGGNGTNQSDAALYEAPQVGSSFKPYVLATALKQGYNVKSMIDGHSPQQFDNQGNSVPVTDQAQAVHNDSGDPPLGVIDLVQATQLSVNTAYVKLGLELGLSDVRKTAEAFGVPKVALDAHRGESGISLGIANYAAVYQAAGYAAFANGGTPVTPHVVTKIERKDGTEVKLPWTQKKDRILTPEQAAQATLAMRSVVTGGTGKGAALPNRPVAGKTGTTDKSAAAWFVGYVPQMSTAVTMFSQKNRPMTSIPGYGGGVYGGQIPASIWRAYMLRATQTMEVKNFTPPTFSEGTRQLWDTPPPKATPTPTVPTTPSACAPGDTTTPGCQSTQTPTTAPGGPIGGGGQPCNQWGLPPGCDPNTPPSNPAPKWWCQQHPGDPSCPAGDPGAGGGNGTPQSRSQTPARRKG
ncbi:MAG: Peptidoglycan glycosyltransferase [Streptosporangiaceae bacterium]|nr:Peptidoglycan glycosyltransferase [Streptosporangiaceae bacterium]